MGLSKGHHHDHDTCADKTDLSFGSKTVYGELPYAHKIALKEADASETTHAVREAQARFAFPSGPHMGPAIPADFDTLEEGRLEQEV